VTAAEKERTGVFAIAAKRAVPMDAWINDPLWQECARGDNRAAHYFPLGAGVYPFLLPAWQLLQAEMRSP
jgi:hypothetical protein